MKARMLVIALAASFALCAGSRAGEAPAPQPEPVVVLPMDRTAYFTGEKVPLAFSGLAPDAAVKLEAVNADGRLLLYSGKPATLLLDTSMLAPGDYVLELNGKPAGKLSLTGLLKKSAGSMQDECQPPKNNDEIVSIFRESGLTASITMAVSDMGRAGHLDAMAKAGALLMVNPDTRPTSFFPVGNMPEEIDGMSQRMALTAQANARYPNFGGFCYGWDTTGYRIGGRRGLLTYWGWGDKTQALRNYIARLDDFTMQEFTRRTGLKAVSDAEYIAYLLSIGRPELAPAIDLPTKVWLEEIAAHIKPLGGNERADIEKRLDAWSQYLMGLYNECYSAFSKNLREVDPAMRHSASVQVDHAAIIHGQYFPSAYEPLDFQYQSAWNDQVGGPDYLYQWLFVSALLDMHRGGKPLWISTSMGPVHGRAVIPGKLVRVAAHIMPFGGSGVGYAHEGFSNLLGGMNKHSTWPEIKGKAAGQDVLSARDFLDRFSALTLEARGDHGVGILFSKTQFSRQYLSLGFGTSLYKALVALTRTGYTPRFVTEDELIAGKARNVKALVVIGQTVPLPGKVLEGIDAFAKNGGKVLVDGATTVDLPAARKMPLTFPFTVPGKPHSWSSPSILSGENETILYARWHPELARGFTEALGITGRALFTSEREADAQVTLMQLNGGPDATYVLAVNDSHVQTQADWHQVNETIIPTGAFADATVVYDCTEEKPLGNIGRIACDLSTTTARVYAVLRREMKSIQLSATQVITAGQPIILRVEPADAAGKKLSAVVPLHISLLRPDGKLHHELYRATTQSGTFAASLPVPANAPAGDWSLAVRCQLDGQTATLPVNVLPAKPAAFAAAWNDPVIVREKPLIESMLAKNAKLALPIAENADALVPAAERIKAVLAKRGVTVDIIRNPPQATYWLAYDLTAEQRAENERVDKAQAIGKISRLTVNQNDWFSALSGYRFPKPLILLDIAGSKGDSPLAEALDDRGILWPKVSAAFPGTGRAVVQGVHWAFAPRVPSLVIQAADADGLLAAADALAKLPDDTLTNGIREAKAELLRQYYVGGRPAQPVAQKLTAKGLKTSRAPKPFAIAFAAEKPLPPDQVRRPERPEPQPYPVPGVFEPKHYIIHIRDGEKLIESATAAFLVPDLRFSQAIMIPINANDAGKVKITAEGVFRYSDRQPCWQAQWEDIINLRDKLVPRQRKPMEIDVQIGGKSIGKLVAVKTAEKEVPLELASPSAALKPKTAIEEVVLQIAGEVDLPAGRHDIMLIHSNIVDGKLHKIYIGVEPQVE